MPRKTAARSKTTEPPRVVVLMDRLKGSLHDIGAGDPLPPVARKAADLARRYPTLARIVEDLIDDIIDDQESFEQTGEFVPDHLTRLR